MRVLITGSSGMLGSALRRHLIAGGHEVVPLVRRPPGEGELSWDPSEGRLDPGVFDGIDGVVNLSGAGIGDRRLTSRRWAKVAESRLGATSLLSASMAGRTDRPAVFVSQSAIGYYGDAGDAVVTESAPAGRGRFAALVADWESATHPASAAGIRTVTTRTGLVLAGAGGLLGRIRLPFRLGLGGRLGSGRQWWSWVSIDDWVRAVTHILGSDLSGPVNVTAPGAVTNAEFTAALGRALHRPTVIPIPEWALRVGLGGDRVEALVSISSRVYPGRLTDDGFEFAQPGIDSALAAIL